MDDAPSLTPSFFTGRLIERLGATSVIMVGLALAAALAAVGLLDTDVTHFRGTLISLGIGWNFGFVGASAMILETHCPEEKARVQSLNDFIVFGTMAVGIRVGCDAVALACPSRVGDPQAG